MNKLTQNQPQRPDQLSAGDRRLLLSATLQFFLHRVRHNSRVSASDLARLVALADDGEDGA